MPWGYAAVAAGTVAAGYMSSDAAGDAAGAQAGAADAAAQLQHQQYLQSREDLAPWRQTGEQALRSLSSLTGLEGEADFSAFERSPGYQFRLQQGEQALNRAASARGRLDSGATMQDLMNYGQGMASEEFGNYSNRLAALAGIGQSATSQTANLGASSVANQGNMLMQAGNARASGYEGQANAINQGFGNLASLYGMYQGMQTPNSLNSMNIPDVRSPDGITAPGFRINY